MAESSPSDETPDYSLQLALLAAIVSKTLEGRFLS
jgi:hypothetical protein